MRVIITSAAGRIGSQIVDEGQLISFVAVRIGSYHPAPPIRVFPEPGDFPELDPRKG